MGEAKQKRAEHPHGLRITRGRSGFRGVYSYQGQKFGDVKARPSWESLSGR